MTTSRSRFIGRLLPLIGIGACVAGAVAGAVSGVWVPFPAALIAAGTVLVVGGLALSWRPGQLGRSVQVGTNAALAIASLVVILGALNFFAVRFGARVDLTETQLFTLSPQTVEVVENLEGPVTVLVFSRTSNPQAEELLTNFSRRSENFSYEFVDPVRAVARAREFEVQADGEVYLDASDRQLFVQQIAPAAPLAETELTAALLKLTQETTPRVYFLQGHGEAALESDQEGGLAQAVEALQQQGFETAPLSLAAADAVPDDAAALAIAGPIRPLFPGEVNAIRRYLERGGSVLLLLDPEVDDAGLGELLVLWGVRFDERVAIDASGRGSAVGLGPVTPLVNEYGEHPIVEPFGNGLSVYPFARPVAILNAPGVTATPLMFTGPQSWAEGNLDAEQLQFDPEIDVEGPLTLGYALSRPSGNAGLETPPESLPDSPEEPDGASEPASELDAPDSEEESASEPAEPETLPEPPDAIAPDSSAPDADEPEEDPAVAPDSPAADEEALAPDSDGAEDPALAPDSPPADEATVPETDTTAEDEALAPDSDPTADETAVPDSPPAEEEAIAPDSGTPQQEAIAPESEAGDESDATAEGAPEDAEAEAPEAADADAASEAADDPLDAEPLRSEARLVAIGNSTFATNGWFEQQLNGDVFLNAVEWLSDTDTPSLTVRPREQADRRLNLGAGQATLLFWLAIAVLPLIGAVGAAIAWFRRR